MKRRLLFVLFAWSASAQIAATWDNRTPAGTIPVGPPWMANGGLYYTLNGSYDPFSRQMVVYGARQFYGTMHVTNGSAVVTWVDGDKFSAIWHAPNKMHIGPSGSTFHVATGTVPSGCGASGGPINCTIMTVDNSAWGTVCNAGCDYNYNAASESIFSDTILYYNSASNTYSYGPGWGALDNMCLPDDNQFGLPDMRQASGNAGTTDIKRHRWYMMGGVNQSCRWNAVTTNGTSTITTDGATGYFTQVGIFNGKTIRIPRNPLLGTPVDYTIASVTNEKAMVLNCGSGSFPACPNIGVVDSILVPAERAFHFVDQANGLYDMWYLTLHADTTLNQFVRVTLASPPSWVIQSTLVSDPDDDVLLIYGDAGGHTLVWCSTEGNPGGTLTAAQTGVGCTTPNEWTELTIATEPPGVYYPALFYDASRRVIWQYGGNNTSGAGGYQRDVWQYCPRTGIGCGTGKVWTQMSSTNQPPAQDTSSLFAHLPDAAWDTTTNKLLMWAINVPAMYVYDPATNAWTTIPVTGANQPLCVVGGVGNNTCPTGTATGYDQGTHSFIASSQTSAANTPLWQAHITYPLSIPITVQEMLYPGDLTGHTDVIPSGGIARSGESFCAGIPLSDAQAIGTTSVLGLTGATAGQFRVLTRWPSGTIKDLEVCGTVASVAAGSTASVSLTNTGSGNFGALATMATVAGGSITINTTGGTCGAGSAICFGVRGSAGHFNGIDSVTIGSTTVVSSGTSTGLVVQGPAYPVTTCGTATPCTTDYTSTNDAASTCAVEKDGPVQSVVRCAWNYKDAGGNVYMRGSARLYFAAGSSKVRVDSVLRNADYGTTNTFATAFKGFQAQELRLGSNLSGTLNFNIGNHTGVGTPTTGTMSGSDVVYIYQGQTNFLGDANRSNCGSPCQAFTTDQGYVVKKNSSTLQSGTLAQTPVGYADLSNGSGVGIGIGSFLFGASGPKSLEFQNGGSGTDAVRIGIRSSYNTYSTYQAWPQWYTDELYLDFHTTAPASPAAEYLRQQHPLVARTSIAQYNASGALWYPLIDPGEEDQWYIDTVTSANPAIPQTNMCANGKHDGLGHGCIKDVGTTDGDFLLYYWPMGYAWQQGGGKGQTEWRYSFLTNWFTRGHTGRLMQVKHFQMMAGDTMNPHADIDPATGLAFTWRANIQPANGTSDTEGRTAASSSQPSGVVNVDSDGVTVTLVSGSYFSPWMLNAGAGTVTINGVNKTIAAITDPTHLTVSTSVAGAPLTGVAYVFSKIMGQTLLRSWSCCNKNPDWEHRTWWSIADYYSATGNESIYDALRNTMDDFHLAMNTIQGTAQNALLSGTGSSNTTTSVFTISTGGPLPSYITIGSPIAIWTSALPVTNTKVYIITAISGSALAVTPSPTGNSWAMLSGEFNARAVGWQIMDAVRYAKFLQSKGDSANSTIAQQQALNLYAMQVKPKLCISDYPTGCWSGVFNRPPSAPQVVTATNANPMVVTTASVTFSSTVRVGDYLKIASATGTGCTGMIGTFQVTATDGTNLTLARDNTGCTYTGNSATVIGATGWPTQGVSPLRGMLQTSSNAGVAPNTTTSATTPGCNKNDSFRAAGLFQSAIVSRGIWELRTYMGPTWSDYYSAGDLSYGLANWIRSEGAYYDGGSLWRTTPWTDVRYGGNGMRNYVYLDIPIPGCDVEEYPVIVAQSVWMAFWAISQTEGATNAWQPLMKQTLQASSYSNPVGVGEQTRSIDIGGYELASVIQNIIHPPTTVLRPITISSFVDNGSGSYTLGWTTPASATGLRIKWAPKAIVDWIGYNPVTASFSAAACDTSGGITGCSGDPTTTLPWFSANDVPTTPVAEPGSAQSVTVATGTAGLVSSNFSLKGYLPAACFVSPASIPSGTVGQTVSYTFTNSGCASSSWSSTGTVPAGLSFNTSTGILSGTYTTASTYSFNILYDTAANALSVMVTGGGGTVAPAALKGSQFRR